MADRRFGWLQFDATDEMKAMVAAFKTLLNPDDVMELEDEPHVTVLYGLSQTDPQLVRDAVAGLWPGAWELGGVSVFRNKRSHVLKVGVSGDKLFHLNRQLSHRVPHKASFPTYIPHLTIGHLKPGQADQYVALGGEWAKGLKAAGDCLVFHSKDRQRYELPL